MENKNRVQIVNEFTKNILIEAGAGSGKTTILVNRILNQIKETDITIDKIVAITFTEKAASSLQERFQQSLFKVYADEPENPKLKKAVENIDKIHISTIHSFCSSMLKEMPFEAGLSLDFTIVRDEEEAAFKKGIFAQFCENSNDPAMEHLKEKLKQVDINPDTLIDTFYSICEVDGVEWIYDETLIDQDPMCYFDEAKEFIKKICEVLDGTDDPSVGFTAEEIKCRGKINEDKEPVIKSETWDIYNFYMQNKNSEPTLNWMEKLKDIDKKMNVCAATSIDKYNKDLFLKGNGRKAKKKKEKIIEPEILGVNQRLKYYKWDQVYLNLNSNYSHYRHALCMRFLMGAINYFNTEKKKEKKLTYKDLLVLARDMIKQSETARQFFRNKYTCFYIDEFQDTDPIQTELIFYLACEQEILPVKWEDCQLKAGTLCMVGDPKQSIFAFTGADIKLYNRVKEKMQQDSNCEVYSLQYNYRSNKEICDWVENSYSKKIGGSGFGFPDQSEEGSSQAIFKGMTTQAPAYAPDQQTLKGVYQYHLGIGTKDKLKERDAPYIAELIAGLIENPAQISRYDHTTKTITTRAVNYGDFLIITWGKKSMSQYVDALKKKGLPVSVAGEIETKALDEVNNLVLLLSYLDDYQNDYQLALVLEKLFACHLDSDQRFTYRRIIWNEDEIQALTDIRIKESLLQIHKLLKLIGKVPPMVVVETIVNDFKTIMANKNYDTITLHSAMGNVEQLLEVVRAESYSTYSDIVKKLQYLTEKTLDREMSLTDLNQEDGEYNAVRIMNLHKAKGLEGNIVILADPSTGVSGFQDKLRFIEEDDIKKGFIIPAVGKIHLGKPEGWDGTKAISDELKKEEHLRLLYVASTRAKEALIVASGDCLNRGIIDTNTAWKELASLIPYDEETKQVCNGMLDYEHIAEKIMTDQTADSPNWGIVDVNDSYAKHKNELDEKIEQAQDPVEIQINPSSFINHKKSASGSSRKTVVESNPDIENNSDEEEDLFKGNLYGIIVHKLFQLLLDNQYISVDEIPETKFEEILKKSILEGLEGEKLDKRQCDLLKLDSTIADESFVNQFAALYDNLREDLKTNAINFYKEEDLWELIRTAKTYYTELPFHLMTEWEKLPENIKNSRMLSKSEITDKTKPIYINGIMDLVIDTGKEYVIIDYKTNFKDKNKDIDVFTKELWGIYEHQLDLYAFALKELVAEAEVQTAIYSIYS